MKNSLEVKKHQETMASLSISRAWTWKTLEAIFIYFFTAPPGGRVAIHLCQKRQTVRRIAEHFPRPNTCGTEYLHPLFLYSATLTVRKVVPCHVSFDEQELISRLTCLVFFYC